MAEQTQTLAPVSPLANWRYVMRTCNCPRGRLDFVSRWLVLTRACVQPMTLTAAAIAGLLAVRAPGFNIVYFLLAAVGLVLAHAANNLMNDYFDAEAGSDTSDYPRALYAPHAIFSGLATKRTLLRAVMLVNVIDLAILVALTVARGPLVIFFALAGLLISVGYTAPPLRFKKRGLGEPGVFLVWGPLMIGGTYFSATGHLGWNVVLASVPYAILATAVLMGKHIDKLPWDQKLGIGTLPVLMGEERARWLTRMMMASFYVLVVALVVVKALPVFALVALLGLPRLRQVWGYFTRPRPEKPPEDYPVWPLWFASAAFVHTRRAGALLIAGMAAGALVPISLPW
jgi:1,4-dihydroxy-2-naphthoate octaprenyltransferase